MIWACLHWVPATSACMLAFLIPVGPLSALIMVPTLPARQAPDTTFCAHAVATARALSFGGRHPPALLTFTAGLLTALQCIKLCCSK